MLSNAQAAFKKVFSLAIEAIAGSLARDLNLPVPEFYLVELYKDFIDTVNCHSVRSMFADSDIYAFGSRHLNGFRV